MPIPGIEQPEVIPVEPGLRLRKFDGIPEEALGWYQDPEVVYLVDGVREPYTREKLDRMYRWLDGHGELYCIEIWENGAYRPIGDVTFWQEDMPIVIGDPACRGRGIGRKVIEALAERGKTLGYSELFVAEIYDFNTASRKCFERARFREYGKTEKGSRFRRQL